MRFGCSSPSLGSLGAAAVAPLLGLLGTVWGSRRLLYDTTQLEVGENQAEALASGIYMAAGERQSLGC
jgi:biopolymer transport protein ExbB/TolQ